MRGLKNIMFLFFFVNFLFVGFLGSCLGQAVTLNTIPFEALQTINQPVKEYTKLAEGSSWGWVKKPENFPKDQQGCVNGRDVYAQKIYCYGEPSGPVLSGHWNNSAKDKTERSYNCAQTPATTSDKHFFSCEWLDEKPPAGVCVDDKQTCYGSSDCPGDSSNYRLKSTHNTETWRLGCCICDEYVDDPKCPSGAEKPKDGSCGHLPSKNGTGKWILSDNCCERKLDPLPIIEEQQEDTCDIPLNTNVPLIGRCIEYADENKQASNVYNVEGALTEEEKDELSTSYITEEEAFPVLTGWLTKMLTTFLLLSSFVMVVAGGVMITASGASETGATNGKKMIARVMIGVGILGAMGTVLHIINPNFFK